LELGGKSPYIVLDDVDIKEAAKATTGKVVNNTGQVCTAGTRVLVPKKIKDAFLAELKEQFSHCSLIHISEPTRRRGISYAVF
ncbi:aldehyde dehydrogenase family protein, partial [Staphylococcus aureus]